MHSCSQRWQGKQSAAWATSTRRIANAAWAFATLGQPDARLFTALAKEAERRVGNFKPQDLANTAWAFATLGQPDAQLSTALAREAEHRVGNFNPQNLANTAWAFATVGQPDAQHSPIVVFMPPRGRGPGRGHPTGK